MKIIMQVDEFEGFDQWRVVLTRPEKLDEHGRSKAEAVEKLTASIDAEIARLTDARKRLQNL